MGHTTTAVCGGLLIVLGLLTLFLVGSTSWSGDPLSSQNKVACVLWGVTLFPTLLCIALLIVERCLFARFTQRVWSPIRGRVSDVPAGAYATSIDPATMHWTGTCTECYGVTDRMTQQQVLANVDVHFGQVPPVREDANNNDNTEGSLPRALLPFHAVQNVQIVRCTGCGSIDFARRCPDPLSAQTEDGGQPQQTIGFRSQRGFLAGTADVGCVCAPDGDAHDPEMQTLAAPLLGLEEQQQRRQQVCGDKRCRAGRTCLAQHTVLASVSVCGSKRRWLMSCPFESTFAILRCTACQRLGLTKTRRILF